MSLIEQAAQRLEQLRRAGVDMPTTATEQDAQVVAVEARRPTVVATLTDTPRDTGEDRQASASSSDRFSLCVDLDGGGLIETSIGRPDAAPSQLADE